MFNPLKTVPELSQTMAFHGLMDYRCVRFMCASIAMSVSCKDQRRLI